MNEEAKDLIDRISSISDNVKKDLKPLIQQLAKNIGDNIFSSWPRILEIILTRQR